MHRRCWRRRAEWKALSPPLSRSKGIPFSQSGRRHDALAPARISGTQTASRVFFEIRLQKPFRRRRVCGMVADWNTPCVVAEGALPGVRKSSRSLPPGGTVHLPWLLIDPLIGAAVHLDQFFGAEEETDLHLTILR